MSEKSFEHYHFECIGWKKNSCWTYGVSFISFLHEKIFFSPRSFITGSNMGCLLCASLNILPMLPVKEIGFRFCFSLMQESILRRKILHIPAYQPFVLVHETFAQVLKSVHHTNLFQVAKTATFIIPGIVHTSKM